MTKRNTAAETQNNNPTPTRSTASADASASHSNTVFGVFGPNYLLLVFFAAFLLLGIAGAILLGRISPNSLAAPASGFIKASVYLLFILALIFIIWFLIAYSDDKRRGLQELEVSKFISLMSNSQKQSIRMTEPSSASIPRENLFGSQATVVYSADEFSAPSPRQGSGGGGSAGVSFARESRGRKTAAFLKPNGSDLVLPSSQPFGIADVYALDWMDLNQVNMFSYYVWSREQAQVAFGVAIGACVCGILLIVASFLLPFLSKLEFNAALYTSIGGMITEVFAGTMLIVYRSSVSQLNYYFKSLHEDERYLYVFDLIQNIDSKDNRDRMLIEIIQNALKINLSSSKESHDPFEDESTQTQKAAKPKKNGAQSSSAGEPVKPSGN